MKLKIQNGAIDINGNALLKSINFEVNDQEHIAIIGANGTGKTTLFKAMIDNEMLIEGIDDEEFRIIKIGNFKIGYLEQIKIHEELSLFEELISSFQELINLEKKIEYLANNLTNDKNILDYTNTMEKYEFLGGYTYQKELEIMIAKFGFNTNDKFKKINEFSGGEKTKISFMKLLLSNYDLLLLDEPTNHLDITAIEWLENYLKNYKKAFIVVSHDRMFLDNVVNIIYNIEYGEMIKYVGNYSKFTVLRQERYHKLLKDYEWQQKEIKRLTGLYERFRNKPTKAKMALSKLKQIERMNLIDKPKKESTKTFKANIKEILTPSKIVLSIKALEFGYDKSLGKLELEVLRGKKIGIIGANGIGKSTLLKTIAKLIHPLNGQISYGYNVKTAYFDQNLKFETNGTIIEEFTHKYPKLLNNEARSALGSFLFSGEDINKKLEVLSGGEKVRLLLCETFFSKANLLLLDEPTNHLDIIGKEKLEKTLIDYPETVIFITHDRYFIKKIADELIIFTANGVEYYPNNYDEYINKYKEIKIEPKLKEKPHNKVNSNKNLSKKIEREIDQINFKIKELTNQLYQENNYDDYQRINGINSKIIELKNQLKIKEKEWEKVIF